MRALHPELRKSPVWNQYTASCGVDGSDVEDVAAKAGLLWAFRIEPTGEPTPPPLGIDLWWIGAASCAGAALLAILGAAL